MASPLIRSVKEFVEVKLLSYTFKFKRLTWVDYFGLSSVEDFRKKVLTVALTEVSGKLLTPDEATTLISSLPPVIIEKVYTIFLGSLDDRRKFSSIDLPQGPDTKDFTHYLQEEGTKKGKIMDEVERQIEMKFGREGDAPGVRHTRRHVQAAQRGRAPEGRGVCQGDGGVLQVHHAGLHRCGAEEQGLHEHHHQQGHLLPGDLQPGNGR